MHRFSGLDALRAAAILWVMVFHAAKMGLISSVLVAHSLIVRCGWMGVDLFFVLSGFLVAGQLFKPLAAGNAPRYTPFLMRRLLRTLPAYLTVVALYFLFPVLREQDAIQPLWQFLTFAQNFFVDTTQGESFSHAWSLCVEEQFYIALPLIVGAVSHRGRMTKALSVLGVAVISGGIILRGILWLSGVASTPFDPAAAPISAHYMALIYYPTWARLDPLVAGVALAAMRYFAPAAWQSLTARPNMLLAGAVIGIGAAMLSFDGQSAGLLTSMFGFSLVALSMGSLVAAATNESSMIAVCRWSGIRHLATGSYSLYLTHKMDFHLALIAVPVGNGRDWPFLCAAALLIAAMLAGTLFWLVERPCLKPRRTLYI